MAGVDFVKFAEACGARGVRIEDPATCREQLRDALATDGPALIECVVDPHVPPIPAKAKKDQVKKLATALRQGTPNRNRIALQIVKDMLDESSFQASPAHVVPDAVSKAASTLVDHLRDRADPEQPD
jgi:pyruvate dehydrogenase (quinone)/pyruvate oxidase